MRWERLHVVLGLLAFAVISIQGLTGALLVFEEDIDRWLNRDIVTVAARGEPLSLEAQLDRFAEQRSDMVRHVYAVRLPDTPRDATLLLAKPSALDDGPRRGVRFMVDPYTGEILGTQRYGDTIMGMVYNLHRRLLLPPWGKWITSTSAIILMASALTGLVVAARRRRHSVRPPGRERSGVHRWVGRWFAPLVFVIAFNGFAVTYRFVLIPALYVVTNTEFPRSLEQRGLLPLPPNEGAPRRAVDELVALANEREPDATPRVVLQPRVEGRPVTVILQKPHETRDLGGTFQILDPHTGRTMERMDFTDGELGFRAVYWTIHLHKGTWGGLLLGRYGALATRILWIVVALMVPVLALSGLRWWWRRRSLDDDRGDPSVPA
ncbi:MAG: PepSY-associated TM helix domain-containing protein [Myxococcota bacterium]